MKTLTPPETTTTDRIGRSRKWLLPLVAMLAVVGIIAGLWVILRSDETDDQTVATELVDTWIRSGDEWIRSGNEQAAEELRSVFTDDARLTVRASTSTVEQHINSLATGATTNVNRVGQLTPAGEGVFTFVLEFDWGGSRWSGEFEVELDGDLISRIRTTRDYTAVGS